MMIRQRQSRFNWISGTLSSWEREVVSAGEIGNRTRRVVVNGQRGAGRRERRFSALFCARRREWQFRRTYLACDFLTASAEESRFLPRRRVPSAGRARRNVKPVSIDPGSKPPYWSTSAGLTLLTSLCVRAMYIPIRVYFCGELTPYASLPRINWLRCSLAKLSIRRKVLLTLRRIRGCAITLQFTCVLCYVFKAALDFSWINSFSDYSYFLEIRLNNEGTYVSEYELEIYL